MAPGLHLAGTNTGAVIAMRGWWSLPVNSDAANTAWLNIASWSVAALMYAAPQKCIETFCSRAVLPARRVLTEMMGGVPPSPPLAEEHGGAPTRVRAGA